MIYATRFPELSIEHVKPYGAKPYWRFVANDTQNHVGPIYKSRAEIMADLEGYASTYGCHGAEPYKPVSPWDTNGPSMLATLRDILELHIAHHNHPHHARAREIIRAIEGEE